jgi:L-ribulose-5-phosphate 3-epimerase
MSNTIAVSTNTYHGFTLDQALAGISAAGFKYVELCAVKGWTEHVMPHMSKDELEAIKKKVADYGLTPVALSGHCSITDEERLPDFIDNIKLAAFFDCKVIVTSIDEAHLKKEESRTARSLEDILEELGGICKEYNIDLVLETHGKEYGSGESILNLLKNVKSENVKINFDTGNVIMYGGKDPVEDLKICNSRVGFIHLKDKLGKTEEWNFPALGTGTVDFPSIFEIAGDEVLKSIEIEFTSAGPKDLNEVDEAVKSSYNYLKSIGVI